MARRTLLAAGLWRCAAAARPNVLFIMADDMGVGEVGAFPGEEPRRIRTPVLDALAAGGMRFSRASTSSSSARWTSSRVMTCSGAVRMLPRRAGFASDESEREMKRSAGIPRTSTAARGQTRRSSATRRAGRTCSWATRTRRATPAWRSPGYITIRPTSSRTRPWRTCGGRGPEWSLDARREDRGFLGARGLSRL
mmetsp:Transcript_5225/g.15501  ORF Transcript_5225/g.15501 Transcript_5225/m.15501 type:complete len:195 (-) Transcript_5225:13-597(-)